MKWSSFLLIFFAICVFYIQFAHSAEDNPSGFKLLQKINKEIDEDHIVSAFNNLMLFFNTKSFIVNNKLNSTLLYQALTLYGRLQLYGVNSEKKVNFQKAFYYFRLASEFGSAEAQYYTAFMEFFRIDGSFTILQNLKNKNETNITYNTELLEQYAEDRKKSLSLLNLYFASIQGHSEAIVAMGYKYLRGVGVKSNCSSASLYYVTVCKELFLDENDLEFIPRIVEKKKIDMDSLHHREFWIDTQKSQAEELEFVLMQVNQNKKEAILKLAHYYYYGMNGVKQDFEMSYKYFAKAAQMGDISAKTTLGFFHLKGIGVPQNFKLAHTYYNEAALNNDARAKNGIGYMYLKGLYVEKNIELAKKYFKSSADAGNADGQYNYGALILLRYYEGDSDTNLNLAHQYITYAAHQGHALATYNLGLMHLDGSSFYYSCELGLRLLRFASEKGKWSDKLKDAYLDFSRDNRKTALVKYLELSSLGYLVGMSNAAILTDKASVLEDSDIYFYNIEEVIKDDPIYKMMSTLKIPHMTDNIISFLYDDFLQLIPPLPQNNSYSARVNRLKELLIPTPTEKLKSFKDINKVLASNLYSLGVMEYDPYSAIKLGDFLFNGVIEQDYQESFKIYEQATKMGLEDKYVAQAYFNLGYMYQFGLGVEKDLNKSWENYNKSSTMNPEAYLSVMSMKLGLDFDMKYANNTIGSTSRIDFLIRTILMRYAPLSNNNHFNIIVLLTVLIMCLLIYRLRLKNFLESVEVSSK